MALADDLKAAEGRLGKKMDEGFGRLTKRLDTLNGTVADHAAQLGLHTTEIAVANEKANGLSVRLAKGEKERGVLFKMVRTLDKTGARQVAYVAGAVTAVTIILQFVVLPLIKHFVGTHT